jgi:3-oxoacyl-(acyl-carrier-protein) synthase
MSGKREQLLAEQERIKLELAKLNRTEFGIVENEYTDTQKIQFFDKFYEMALDTVKAMEDTGISDDDDEHWFYEMGMSILNLEDTDKLWKYINTLI